MKIEDAFHVMRFESTYTVGTLSKFPTTSKCLSRKVLDTCYKKSTSQTPTFYALFVPHKMLMSLKIKKFLAFNMVRFNYVDGDVLIYSIFIPPNIYG